MRRPGMATMILWTSVLASGCRAAAPTIDASHLVADYPSVTPDGLVNVVIEIPAGTSDKWEVDKATGQLHWELVDGRPRLVDYLAYPGNYGMVPRTSLPAELGGDGDPLDVLILGPAVERGALVAARPIGVLRLTDTGERDDKILAVMADGPLSAVRDLESLDRRYPGVRVIIETWFANYKGPGVMASAGFEDAAAAMAIVREASRYYEPGAGG